MRLNQRRYFGPSMTFQPPAPNLQGTLSLLVAPLPQARNREPALTSMQSAGTSWPPSNPPPLPCVQLEWLRCWLDRRRPQRRRLGLPDDPGAHARVEGGGLGLR